MQALLPSSPAPLASAPEQLPSATSDEAARRIDDALLKAEDHMALSMWDKAAAALDALPAHAKRLPHVVLLYLDLMIGQQLWDRGLMNALGMLESRPNDSELWLRIARLMAGAGNLESARAAAARCVELNPESYFFLVKNGLIESRAAQNEHAAPKRRSATQPISTPQKKVA